MTDPDTWVFPHICVVEASAGSGKTYVLAVRYLQLLLARSSHSVGNFPLESILAITFSNKAAQEMKGRIVEFLKRIALDDFVHDAQRQDLLRWFGPQAQVSGAKAAMALEQILSRYDFFQVRTIDSFINTILSSCSFAWGRSASFDVRTDHRQYLEYAFNRLIDQEAGSAGDPQSLFGRFLTRYLYLENKVSWFPKKDILAMLGSLYGDQNIHGMEFFRAREGESVLKTKKEIVLLIKDLVSCLPEGTHASFSKTLSAFAARTRSGFDFAELSKYFAYESIPIRKGQESDPAADQRWKRVRVLLTEAAEKEAESVFDSYIEIYEAVKNHLGAICRQEDVLFLEELNRQAHELFASGAVRVADLYLRLSTRLLHFLVDEFQDTSPLQWHNLRDLVQEALATGGSLFYVGDRKQSIYRFRGADVTLFDSVQAQWQGMNLVRSSLECNRRSQKRIVEFCNDLFCEENLTAFFQRWSDAAGAEETIGQEYRQAIVSMFRGHHQRSLPEQGQGCVRLEVVQGDRQRERHVSIQRRLLDILGQIRAHYPWKSIAVLTRDNEQVESVSTWLLQEGIPVSSEKTLNIRHSAVIQDIVSLLRFLNSPIDDMAFSAFLLGEVFRSASGFALDQVRDFLFSHRPRSRKKQAVHYYKLFQQEHPATWQEYFDEFFRNVGFVPVYELVVSMVGRLGCLQKFPLQQAFLMHFLELVKRQGEESWGVGEFLDYFDQGPEDDFYIKVAQVDAVSVMTIHKAKGLGFAAVVLPFVEMSPQVESDRVWPLNEGLARIRLSEKYRLFSPRLEKLYEQQKYWALLDEMNSLYVAFTRARDVLWCLVPDSGQRAKNLFRFLCSRDKIDDGVLEKAGRTDHSSQERDHSAVILPASRFADWIQCLKEDFPDSRDFLWRQERRRGEFIHFVMSRLGNMNQKDPDSVLQEVLLSARRQFPDVTEVEQIQGQIRDLLQQAALRSVFFVDDGEVLTEQEIVDEQGRLHRLDRLVVRVDSVMVVDYKSRREKATSQTDQVSVYMGLVSRIYKNRRTQGILVYVEDGSWQECYG